MTLRLIGATVALAAVSAGALLAPGRTRVIDGDTIAIGRQHVRLWGIDAPDRPEDMKQAAGDFLAQQIEREGGIECATAPAENQAVRRSRAPSCASALTSYERIVAACRFKRTGADVAARMALAGYAVDWRRFSAGYYAAAADQARADRAGLWRARRFQMEDLAKSRGRATGLRGGCATSGSSRGR